MSFLIENILKQDDFSRSKASGCCSSHQMQGDSMECSLQDLTPIDQHGGLHFSACSTEDADDEEHKAACRRRRVLFTHHQTCELTSVFRTRPYLSASERDALSKKLNLSPTQVKIWFQNHRYKLRKYVRDTVIIKKHRQGDRMCKQRHGYTQKQNDDIKRICHQQTSSWHHESVSDDFDDASSSGHGESKWSMHSVARLSRGAFNENSSNIQMVLGKGTCMAYRYSHANAGFVERLYSTSCSECLGCRR